MATTWKAGGCLLSEVQIKALTDWEDVIMGKRSEMI